MAIQINDVGENNNCSFPDNIGVNCLVNGNNNIIKVLDSTNLSELTIVISGNNNTIEIDTDHHLKGAIICVGNRIPAHGVNLSIGKNFTIEGGSRFYLFNSGNKLVIGENCMFSNSITIRTGDSPHLIFDKTTGDYLDVSEGIFIGDHVWVGENVYILKSTTVGNECVVGAHSVITKRFFQNNAVIAGNPAKIVREGIQWIRSPELLDPSTEYFNKYYQHQKKFS